MPIRLRSVFHLLMLAGFVSGCALPVPEGTDIPDFIPQEEVVTVSLYREGIYFFNQSRFIDAELKFRQVLYLNPNLPNARLNLAVSLERGGLPEEAVPIYRQLLQEKPKSIPYLSGLARAYAAKGDYVEALAQYKVALGVALDAADMPAAFSMSRSISVLAFKIGDEQEALCGAMESYTYKTDSTEFFRNMRLLTAMGRVNQMLGALTTYMAANGLEKNPDFLHQRAVALLAQGNAADALELENLAFESPSMSATLQVEAHLVKFLAENIAARGAEKPDYLKEKDQQLIENVRQLLESDTTQTLYWPIQVEDLALQALEKTESEEGGGFLEHLWGYPPLPEPNEGDSSIPLPILE